ncbi:hypothetical protein KAS08_01035 [Candidatus Pacearchaeota archaeon]|nr:hypothetical protein [Candidatus Pacearchaeota archaeon]
MGIESVHTYNGTIATYASMLQTSKTLGKAKNPINGKQETVENSYKINPAQKIYQSTDKKNRENKIHIYSPIKQDSKELSLETRVESHINILV